MLSSEIQWPGGTEYVPSYMRRAAKSRSMVWTVETWVQGAPWANPGGDQRLGGLNQASQARPLGHLGGSREDERAAARTERDEKSEKEDE